MSALLGAYVGIVLAWLLTFGFHLVALSRGHDVDSDVVREMRRETLLALALAPIWPIGAVVLVIRARRW